MKKHAHANGEYFMLRAAYTYGPAKWLRMIKINKNNRKRDRKNKKIHI
jgi:hypothetical protein